MSGFFPHSSSKSKIIVISGVMAMFLLLTLQLIDLHLISNAAPNGIISFELSQNLLQALKIISSWDATAKIFAAFSLGIDYLFLVTYSLFLFLAVFRLSDSYRVDKSFIFYSGLLIAYLQILAGILDAVENYALLNLLSGSYEEIYVHTARICASFKFTFVALGLLFILAMLITKLFRKPGLKLN